MIKTAVLQDLKKVDFELKTDDTEKYYTILKNIYPKIVKRQVCLKRYARECDAPCMDSQLDKAITLGISIEN